MICVVFLVATNLNNLDEVKLEYIETLSDNGLEQLIDGLSKRYYQAFIDGDVDRMNSTLSFIEDIDLIDENSANADVMELCMLIDVDFEDIEPMHFENGGFNV